MHQEPVGEVTVLAAEARGKADLLILPMRKDGPVLSGEAEAVLGGLATVCRTVLASGDFRADLGETLLLYGEGGPALRLLLLGMGDSGDVTRERIRSAGASAGRRARDLGVVRALLLLPLPDGIALPILEQVELLIEGALLGTYQFNEFKTVNLEKYKSMGELAIVLPPGADLPGARRACERARVRAGAVNWARDLATTPPNILTPTALADRAEAMAKEEGLRFRRLDRAECERLGMHSFLSVSRGSEEPPWFLLMEYDGPDPAAPLVGLVGKGLTFDSGGISLKPPASMHEMKYDMCGAAAVLGVMKSLHALGTPLRVVAAIPATENLPGGRATRPGDLIKSLSGKTVEILNTDAEGRLALADALTYVIQNHHPAAVIDLATLTGAVLYALGHYGAAVLANNDALWKRIKAASGRSGERAWRLPLWEEFPEHLKGEAADLKNIGDSSAGAGTIAGGVFLKEFVGETPWAHLDIAGAAYWDKDRPLYPKGPTGYGVRLICDLLEELAAHPELPNNHDKGK